MVEMDGRSPLSPKGANSAIELEVRSGSVAKETFIQAASAAYKRKSAAVRCSPRTRRPATVDWLANFEAQDMKQLAAQAGSILGQHDENFLEITNAFRAAEKSSGLDHENTGSGSRAVREPGRLESGEEAADINGNLESSSLAPPSDQEKCEKPVQSSNVNLEGPSLTEAGEESTSEMVGAGQSPAAEAQEDAEAEEEDEEWDALPTEKV